MWSRTAVAVVLALVAVDVAHATGFGGDNPPSRIPIPAREFKARVEDHGGTVVEVDRVTYNGEVFLYGKLGLAQVTLPFESLARVEFTRADDPKKRLATATTIDGNTLTITVEYDTPCYGRTRFGNYAIDAEHLRRIEFLHSP